jgi:hypothetical protein
MHAAGANVASRKALAMTMIKVHVGDRGSVLKEPRSLFLPVDFIKSVDWHRDASPAHAYHFRISGRYTRYSLAMVVNCHTGPIV